MAINLSDNTPRQEYTVSDGNSQQVFAVPFEFFADGDLNVYQDGTLKTLTTDYRTADNNDASDPDDHTSGTTGYIHFTSTITASGADVKIVITRAIDIERTTDFPTSGPFDIASLNTGLDKVIAIQADLQDDIARSLRLTDYDIAATLTLPDVDTRKGKTLAFNATSGAVEAGPSIGDVQTVSAASADIATLADIEDGTDATDAIQTVAGISSNVTTVAGISSNVTTVAGISSDVTAVAGDASDIGTVASNISSVNTVATNITDVVAVANDLAEATSEIVTVADDLNEAVSEIDTVANNITNVNKVGAIDSDVTTVAGIQANVTTVAGISANTTTVAGISSDVTTVAGISSDVTAVAGDEADIGTVAGISSNVTTVAGISANVTTVAGISADVTTVAGDAADIATVAARDADIGTVASRDTDIGTVAGSDANIGTVATNISSVNTVATNISGVNSFGERYRVSATAPASSLDAGDLWFDTTNNLMKVYGTSGFVNAGSSVNGTSERQDYVVGTASGSYTGSTTDFPATYDAGFVDVYLNGIKLQPADFTATSGTNVVLGSAAQTNDTVSIVGYGTFDLSNFSIGDANNVDLTGLADDQYLQYNSTSGNFEPATVSTELVNDTTPQLGGTLDTNGQAIQFGSSKWTIELSSNDLIFKYNGTAKIKFASDGEIVTVDDVTAFGTI